MASITIQHYWHASKAFNLTEGEKKGKAVVYGNGGGYSSLQEMQKELKRRFPHKTELTATGVKMEESCGSYSIVTWND